MTSEPALRRLHVAVFFARARAAPAARARGARGVRLRLALRSACAAALLRGWWEPRAGTGSTTSRAWGPSARRSWSSRKASQILFGSRRWWALATKHRWGGCTCSSRRASLPCSTTPLTLTPRHTQVGGEASDRQLVRLATRCFQCIANEVRLVGTASLSATAHVSHSGAAAGPGAPLSGRWLDAGGGLAAERRWCVVAGGGGGGVRAVQRRRGRGAGTRHSASAAVAAPPDACAAALAAARRRCCRAPLHAALPLSAALRACGLRWRRVQRRRGTCGGGA